MNGAIRQSSVADDRIGAVPLTTTLQIPPAPARSLRRERLVDTLEHGITKHKLVLVAAPAGYGKTTLLVQWAHVSRFQIAWLSLDAEDDDATQFFRCLLAAWERLQPDIRAGPLGVLLGGAAPDIETVQRMFVNIASELSDHTAFVLDDFHLLRDDSIHEALAFLIDHLPPLCHIVIGSRAEPALPLARYRARQELLEVRTRDLQFAPEETAAFLAGPMGLELAHDAVTALHTQLEGWIAGLQLSALALRRGLTPKDMPDIGGQHRFIADYFQEDVLTPLAPELRQFLLETSILDRLCGALCDAVTDGTGGQALLERLEREQLFLQPLDDRREWFRYHRLFAEALQAALQRQRPDDVRELHRRAARWHLAHQLPEQALHHAVAGDDAELAAQVGERYFERKLLSGEFATLHRWLGALPAQWQTRQPALGLLQAGVHLFSGAFDAGIRCVDDVEASLTHEEPDDKDWQLARVGAIRCAIACFQNDLPLAETYADSALHDLPHDDHMFRAIILHSLGDTYRRNGRWEEARSMYLDVLDLVRAPSFRIRSAHIFGALADLELEQGRLRQAASYWRKALEVIEAPDAWGQFPLPLSGWVYIRVAEILYEWNQLGTAAEYLARGLQRAKLGGDVRALLAGYLLASRLELTRGNVSAAVAQLERARPLVEQATFPGWAERFERLQLECWLAQGHLRAVATWADEIWQRDARTEAADLALARALLVKGDLPAVDRARALLKRLIDTAETAGRMGVAVEALALEAVALSMRGDQAGALAALGNALRRAEPEGYVRRFADLGLPMAQLLYEAQARDVMPEHVEALLAAFGEDFAAPAPPQAILPEPLTEREQEILELIAAGLTNREIGEQLVISAETVKKHAGSIYGKLGVHSRTEAAARARELGLLA